MRSLRRSAGVALAVLLAGMPVPPAAATPGPHVEQWWFTGWQVQSKIWPLAKGENVTVAVIDTGVSAGLPEFDGVVLPGADFADGATDGRTDTDTDEGHGTAMAALIAAQGGPTGWVGVAPEAKILPIVLGGSPEELAEAIRYATDHGAGVISMSFGNPGADSFPHACPPVVQDSIRYAVDHDVVLVAAAGNNGDTGNAPEYPASCAGVLAVGALDGNSLRPWSRTQRQDYVAAAAPGAQVGSVGKNGHLYHDGAGTSQAAALTAGAVALVRSELPELSGRAVVQRLLNTTMDVGPKGPDNQTGRGLVLPYFAITGEVPASAPNPVYERLDQVVAQPSPPGRPGGGGQQTAALPPPGGTNPGPGGAVAVTDDAMSVKQAVLLGIAALVVLVLLVAVAVAVIRSRRRTGYAPAGTASWPPPPGSPNPFGAAPTDRPGPPGPPPG